MSNQAGSEAALPRPGLPADPDEDIFAVAKPTEEPDGEALQTHTPPASPASELHDASPEAAELCEANSNAADQAYRDSSTAYGSSIDPMKLLEQESLAAAVAAAEAQQDSHMDPGLAEAPSQPGGHLSMACTMTQQPISRPHQRQLLAFLPARTVDRRTGMQQAMSSRTQGRVERHQTWRVFCTTRHQVSCTIRPSGRTLIVPENCLGMHPRVSGIGCKMALITWCHDPGPYRHDVDQPLALLGAI